MKKIFATLLLFQILMRYASAQMLSGDDMVGKWEVVDVQVYMEKETPDFKEKMAMLKKGFIGTHFVFKADAHFSYDAEFLDMGIKNGHWKYDEKTKSYIIQEWEDRNADKNAYMGIWAKRDNDRTLLLFDETGLEMQVIKVN